MSLGDFNAISTLFYIDETVVKLGVHVVKAVLVFLNGMKRKQDRRHRGRWAHALVRWVAAFTPASFSRGLWTAVKAGLDARDTVDSEVS